MNANKAINKLAACTTDMLLSVFKAGKSTLDHLKTWLGHGIGADMDVRKFSFNKKMGQLNANKDKYGWIWTGITTNC